jgi:hypothetical protein
MLDRAGERRWYRFVQGRMLGSIGPDTGISGMLRSTRISGYFSSQRLAECSQIIAAVKPKALFPQAAFASFCNQYLQALNALGDRAI